MFKYHLYKILKLFHLISKEKLQKITNQRNYLIIKNSKYFDIDYYLLHNEDVKLAKIDAITHYLQYGWKENRDCTPIFDGNEYLRKHLEVYKLGIPPLLHYELYGKKDKTNNISNNKINIINNISKESYNDIQCMKQQIDKHNIISFDIFDTLLLRPYICPTDLFEHLGKLNNIDNFKEIRIKAEKTARKVNYHKEDITIDDIYEQIPNNLKHMKDKEQNLELKVLMPNFEMLDVFNYAIKQNKTVIITSDMYLHTEFLEKALQKNGFKGYNRLYVSSDVQKGKGKTLFNYILKDLQALPQDILHIGDNLSSDYNKPVSLGISGFYYKKVSDIFFSRNIKAKIFWNDNKSFEASILLMSLAIFNHQNREISYWKRFGFEYGGPVCYWYLKWIEKQITNKHIDDIIFVARDGYTLEKIFKLFKIKNIKTHYIYASRQLFINCCLDDAIKDNRCLSLIDAFKEIDEEIKRASYILHSEDAAREFVKNNYQKFDKLCKKQFTEYKQYIKKQNIKGKKIAIVDTITGAGSSIKLLKSVFPQSKITSFFWICLYEAQQYIDAFGIQTFSSYPNHKHIATWDIVEYIMTSPEPPMLRLENNKIIYKSHITNDEYERIDRYKLISEYSILFSKQIEKYFSDILTINEDFIVQWLNILFDANSGYDKKYLANINCCADSAHNIQRPLYKKWFYENKMQNNHKNANDLKSHFDDLKLFLNRLIEKKLSTMMMHQLTFPQFKDKHQGKDIVILASGPTLQYFTPINDCIYIGVNKSFTAHKIKLDYLFIQDFSGTTSGYIDEINKLDCTKFYGLTSENIEPYRTIPESIRLSANAYSYRTDWEDISNFKTEFAYDLSVQSLGCGGTIVFPALQFALWTNPRRIYLVGADTNNSGYFEGNNKNILYPNKLIPLYKKFKLFAQQYYPYTEIISVNPVGLKGIFEDIYTDEYLDSLK